MHSTTYKRRFESYCTLAQVNTESHTEAAMYVMNVMYG